MTLKTGEDLEADSKFSLKTHCDRLLFKGRIKGRARDVHPKTLRVSTVLFGHQHFLIFAVFRYALFHRKARITETSPEVIFSAIFALPIEMPFQTSTAFLSVVVFGKILNRSLSGYGVAKTEWMSRGYARNSGMMTGTLNLFEPPTLNVGIGVIGFINVGMR